jgi:hypothetical protein
MARCIVVLLCLVALGLPCIAAQNPHLIAVDSSRGL